ncbi:GNAT family N-acetyltransferase [Salinirubellus salinus]|uniref:GNAT family N-acetyltransferase n=1 Tax=Salinirubellus salinus TaxID=1364945 RepID=A0A9E7U6Y8_9EURY|nr:N-acetyltransferase [Salinirubellus salinus]UWM52921.1 GNAT family N-acetyltransferase [Salinirubellus salinus]
MIRDATDADLPRLETIRAVALPDSSARLLAFGVRGPAVALVAVETPARSPVGYALVLPDEAGRVAYLAELAVAPGHRRRGHGRALLEAAARRVADHDRLELTTRAADDRARAFYRDAGFDLVERLPAHYETADRTQDGVRLGRSLDS